MGDQSDNESDSDDDDDADGKDNYHTTDGNNVGFDQLINEDSDDDAPVQSANISKNTSSSRFMTSRHKEQQYEHFQDSDDDDNANETNVSTPKASSSKFK